MAGAVGNQGLQVLAAGVELAGVMEGSPVILHQRNGNSTASFRMKGSAIALAPPAFGTAIEIKDRSANRVLFSGTVRTPAASVELSDKFADLQVRCVGVEDALRDTVIQGPDGIAIVEKATAAEQFSALVALVPGYTGTTDIGAGTRVTTDVRYSNVDTVLRGLGARNDAVLSVTPGKEVRLRKRSALPASTAPRIMSGHVEGMEIEADSRQVRSRQFVRYGDIRARRSIQGDGAERAFLVAGTQTPVDLMADGVMARALNAPAGDQGLRFRDDAAAAVRPTGGIDFFGGAAADPASGVYIGATLAAAASTSLRMLTDGKMQLRTGLSMSEAERYAIALRHSAAPNPVWTSDGITPTLETEGGNMMRDSAADFSLRMGQVRNWTRHGDTYFALLTDGTIEGWRRSGNALVRDSRFDANVSAFNARENILVVGDRLFLSYQSNGRRLAVWSIGAGTLTRTVGSDQANVGPFSKFTYVDGVNVFTSSNVQNWQGYTVSNTGVFVRDNTLDYVLMAPPLGSISSQRTGYLYHDGWHYRAYWRNAPYRPVLVRWKSGTTETLEDSSLEFRGSASFLVLADRIFMRANPNFGSVMELAARAVSISEQFLQWQAPVGEYNTLDGRRAANSGFRVAIMDPDVVGVSVPAARYVPPSLDVQSVSGVTLNGTSVDLGEEYEWVFDVARQKLVQDASATPLTATDALVVDYVARVIAQSCNPMASIMRDFFEDLHGSDGVSHAEATAVAAEQVTRFGILPWRVGYRLKPTKVKVHIEEGETMQFESAMLRRYGVSDAMDADKWVVFRVQITQHGKLIRYAPGVQRGRFRDEWTDWWRDFLDR